MTPAKLGEIVLFLNDYLRIGEIADYPEAHNGLQLENGGEVTRIGAAVDACGYTIERAAKRGIDLLLVHHGLMWGGVHPLTGGRYRMLKLAFDGGVAVYGAHLPLDAHPLVGNTALLCAALGLTGTQPFFPYKGTPLGEWGHLALDRDVLARRLEEIVGHRVRVCPGGPSQTSRVGVVTGGAGAELREAVAAGLDTFITGEGPHWTYALAEELGINVLYGGHYATETFGVKALAAHLGKQFGLPWEFIDHPTGL